MNIFRKKKKMYLKNENENNYLAILRVRIMTQRFTKSSNDRKGKTSNSILSVQYLCSVIHAYFYLPFVDRRVANTYREKQKVNCKDIVFFPKFGASFNLRNFSIVRSVHYNNTVHGTNGTKKKYSEILKYSEDIYFEENLFFIPMQKHAKRC